MMRDSKAMGSASGRSGAEEGKEDGGTLYQMMSGSK
jgi:hypothetical protein|tara:strand:+ start:142 stop:249 length:108 start_codon:yes stop_codon:yes gene_type:complete